METYNVILERRSTRKYKDIDISDDAVKTILSAGIAAPSSKNKQPWKFIITKGSSKEKALSAMERGIANAKSGNGLLPTRKHLIPSVENTLQAMKQAPVVVFVFNTEVHHLFDCVSTEERFVEVSNILSIGAAIENMLIMANDLGVASLWICDTVFAYTELCECLGESNQLVSAIAFGYADEEPRSLKKKDWHTVVEWR